ncbi:MAG: hypothetical protein K0S44_211 [Bacteroidetes bacterium]|jgi:S-adenosylmethionine:tRNA-ribosyltransferase-isomerase (queuine synthetase)|nr:hypothetical protein [Bacteroidota bacterium]
MGAVSRDIAEKEIAAWLDFKNVKEKRRDEKKEAINELTDAVEEGAFVIEADSKVIKYKLLFPIKGDVSTTELLFSPRISAAQIQAAMSGVKSDDIYGMITAYGSVLTGQPKNVIKALDTEDYNMVKKVAIFFM